MQNKENNVIECGALIAKWTKTVGPIAETSSMQFFTTLNCCKLLPDVTKYCSVFRNSFYRNSKTSSRGGAIWTNASSASFGRNQNKLGPEFLKNSYGCNVEKTI